MKTLTEISQEKNFATPEAARASLDYARRFTTRFREVEALDTASREAEMLELQFPACLQPPEPGDLFVGRILFTPVGVSPEPAGMGWYFDFAGFEQWSRHPECTPEEAALCRELADFWRTRTSQARARAAYPPAIASTLPSDEWFTESGVGFPLYRIGGMVPDFGILFSAGLGGIVERCNSAADPRLRAAMERAVRILQRSIDQYAGLEGIVPEVRETLLAIRERPPRTLREAIQVMWLWVLHSGLWNLGRLDVALGPFLVADLEAGQLSEDQALELTCSLWRLIHGYTNQYNNRVIVGGRGRPNEAAADRFALLAIEATRRVRLNQPQLTLRFYSGQAPVLWERGLDAIGEGCTYPMLYNDDVNIPAVSAAFGVDDDLAAEYTPFGCGEYVLGPFSLGTPNGVINLSKALEVALHGGVDPATGRRILDLPEPAALDSFEKVWQAYATVVELFVDALARTQKIGYESMSSDVVFLFASMLMRDCLERGKGLLDGGLRHLGGTLETYGNSNAADSLHVIKELVFDRRELALGELVAILDANFEGHEEIRRLCLAVSKYGNDEATADAMARRVHDHVCHFTRDRAALHGLDSYLVVIINNWANVVLGRCVGASAEGRRAGEPLANGNNPTPGSDRNGPTAFLNSLARLDPSIHAGAVQNMKFTREWFRPDTRPKFDGLLRAYFAQGGTQAMITVVSREDLESAMREPDKWAHLLVRVGGFSIRFIDLPRDAQCEVLQRTLH